MGGPLSFCTCPGRDEWAQPPGTALEVGTDTRPTDSYILFFPGFCACLWHPDAVVSLPHVFGLQSPTGRGNGEKQVNDGQVH